MRTQKIIYSSLIFILLFTGINLNASDSNSEKVTKIHKCYKPKRPVSFDSEITVENYNNFIEVYSECLKEYISDEETIIQQKELEILKHQKNYKETVEEYNQFIKEMNKLTNN